MNEGEIGGRGGFEAYVEALIEVIGHADRAEPLHDYCQGLMMPIARKSVESLAAVTASARVSAKHQSLLHFVGQSPWSDEALIARVRDWVLPRMVEGGVRSPHGSSTTRASRRKAGIRWVSRANIAANWASKIIVRWR